MSEEILNGVRVETYEGNPPSPKYELRVKPVVAPMPRDIWLRHRARELSRYLHEYYEQVEYVNDEKASEVISELLWIVGELT